MYVYTGRYTFVHLYICTSTALSCLQIEHQSINQSTMGTSAWRHTARPTACAMLDASSNKQKQQPALSRGRSYYLLLA